MPYRRMNEEQVHAFLTAEPPRPGILSTVRADGRPHVAPVWFEVDDTGALVFTTGAETVKGRNLRRTGWAAMCIDDDRPPYAFVVVEGPVTIVEDLDAVRACATRLGGRYVSEDQAEAYGARNGVPGELLIRLQPERLVSALDVAD